MSYKEDFLDLMEKVSDLASDFGISKEELEHTLMAFSQPTSEDIDEMTKEMIDKMNSLDSANTYGFMEIPRSSKGKSGEGFLKGKRISKKLK